MDGWMDGWMYVCTSVCIGVSAQTHGARVGALNGSCSNMPRPIAALSSAPSSYSISPSFTTISPAADTKDNRLYQMEAAAR